MLTVVPLDSSEVAHMAAASGNSIEAEKSNTALISYVMVIAAHNRT